MEQEENIVRKVQLLEELVASQTKTLETANIIINMKNRLIELGELEIQLHKRENSRLQRVVFGLFILLVVSSIMHIVR